MCSCRNDLCVNSVCLTSGEMSQPQCMDNKIALPLFGAGYAVPNKGKQFYTNLDRHLKFKTLPELVQFNYFHLA